VPDGISNCDSSVADFWTIAIAQLLRRSTGKIGNRFEHFGQRWFVSHGRKFGLGVSDLCADGIAGDVFSHEADAVGAGDAIGDRVSESISGQCSGRFEFSSGLDNGDGDIGVSHADRRGDTFGGGFRLFDDGNRFFDEFDVLGDFRCDVGEGEGMSTIGTGGEFEGNDRID
jgi:hypothetical protein